MYKIQTIGPAVDAITLADVKLKIYIKNDSRDSEIINFIPIATSYVEKVTERALVDQEFDIWYDGDEFAQMTQNGVAYLSTLNVTSIESIKYYSDDGTETELDSTTYRLQNNQAKFDQTRPNANTRTLDGWKISVKAGYGADDTEIPEQIKTAIAYMIKHYLAFKGNVHSSSLDHIPDLVKTWLTPYKSTMNWIN